MTTPSRPAALCATELLAAYADRALSPVEVLLDVADVVGEREPTLNALWVNDLETRRDALLEAARASERRWVAGSPDGPLDGVPVTVKENLARAGVPMPAGNAGTSPAVPTRSSPVVARIEEAAGTIIGSTVMPDWGMLSSGVSSLHGVTRSPWDERLTTGGSSSGAGAAAASGYGPLHVGTDIGGSIRLPGTWLGLTTLKPSAGRVPLDTPYLGRVAGPLTRSAADAALLLSVISGPDPRDWTALPPGAALPDPLTLDRLDNDTTRIGLLLDAGCGTPVDPEVRAVIESAAAVFAASGAEVVPLEPFMTPEWLVRLDEFWRVRSLVELDALDDDAQDRVLPFVRRWAEAGRSVDGRDVMRDYAAIMAIQQATVAATERCDLVLSPVAPMAAFPAEWPMPWGDGDEAMPHIGFTAPFNLSGQPAGTVNAGFTADGRTVGLQISGRRFDDVAVLRALHWFEQHRPAGAAPTWPIAAESSRPQSSGVPRWQTASTLLPSGSRTKAP
ncbi:aspartyl-tRNA(Asn)/glutamyl-tRNA(Gln) amidotransferase subunit A [Humibacillus xanthopallidus]|uniref:Aspartyl-tRNA(Asn)/glutamyl-tRNA(Gln) amidotransferase subunit A n=1 Tax=Humibacillus xanthopallidus TaxID=412689 RepID=A0A543PW72_9MICO|nr:aspartyl-tRNA(Asn)/glutamyl-tRNA(Gln) amidotransferase subunit A [Humibacillus xanthopallidus]